MCSKGLKVILKCVLKIIIKSEIILKLSTNRTSFGQSDKRNDTFNRSI